MHNYLIPFTVLDNNKISIEIAGVTKDELIEWLNNHSNMPDNYISTVFIKKYLKDNNCPEITSYNIDKLNHAEPLYPNALSPKEIKPILQQNNLTWQHFVDQYAIYLKLL